MRAGTEFTAAADRFEAVREHLRASTVPLEGRAADPRAVRITARAARLGAILLHTVDAAGLTGVRTPALARDDTEPRLIVSLVHSGAPQLALAGRAIGLLPGDLVAVPSTLPQVSSYGRGAVKSAVMIRIVDLDLPQSALAAAAGVPLPPVAPAAQVLRSHLVALADAAPRLTAQELDAYERPTLDLVRVALASLTGVDAAVRDSAQRSLAARLLEHARRHLADPGLNVRALAEAHHVSERTVYAALAAEGTTLGDHLRQERVAAAARLLRDPAAAGWTISAVAHRCGFVDHSHFTRAFHRRYGMTPTEWRAGR